MPNSPHVDFNVINGNVEVATPQQGVSHIIGRTTKGKPFSPDVVISTLEQFRETYGKEIVPDGTISNMETALKGGSKLRISRVLASDAVLGMGKVSTSVDGDGILVAGTNGLYQAALMIKVATGKFIFLSLNSKGYGEEYPGITSNTFGLKVTAESAAGLTQIYISAYNTLKEVDMVKPVYKTLVAKYTDTVFDTQVLKTFIESNPMFNVSLLAAKVDDDLSADDWTGINSIPDVYLAINENWNTGKFVSPFNSVDMANADHYKIVFDLGSQGGVPDLAAWKSAYDATLDYADAYQLGISHVNQSLDNTDLNSLYTYVANNVIELKEVVLYIDVPLYEVSGVPKDKDDIKTWVEAMIATIGYSEYIAYFAGGYKYNNAQGFVTDAANLGTVLALGDVSASTKGPWYHFSGYNRGLVVNSKGIVSPNYGSPSNYSKLNELANARVNMAVIKDTGSFGKQVMLVHNFTSALKTDSFRYLGVVRLILYLKKQFRPILESALEEPNTPPTWRTIHRSIMNIVDDVVSRNGMLDPVYTGDQDATSLSGLTYNKEVDVRQGKYKAKLTFKDVIALQEITFDLEIDTVNNQVNIQ